MLNNKGFAVTTVLYTLLIAFLMFLGAALAQFSSATDLIGKSNNDMVNGANFDVLQVKPVFEKPCGSLGYEWYNTNTIVKIKNRYGIMYWPKDFGLTSENGILTGADRMNKKIKVECFDEFDNLGPCTGLNLTTPISQSSIEYGKLKITDVMSGESKNLSLYNICK